MGNKQDVSEEWDFMAQFFKFWLKHSLSMKNNLSIHVNGISVSYKDSGKHTLAIIFVHGFPFNKSTWEPQYNFLKETHRVIIYDLPGFGESAMGAEESSIHFYADHLVKFMDTLQIKKGIVCGLSMGGYILLNAVERYPERFEALILCDTQCLADTAEGKLKRMDTIGDIKKSGLISFADGFLKKAFSKQSLEIKKYLVEKIKNVILGTAPETITSALQALAERKETCIGLKNIFVPTLILCGEEDLLTPIPLSEFLFNTIPNSELHIIKKAGHLCNLEEPDIFNDHLHNFISDIIL